MFKVVLCLVPSPLSVFHLRSRVHSPSLLHQRELIVRAWERAVQGLGKTVLMSESVVEGIFLCDHPNEIHCDVFPMMLLYTIQTLVVT